MSNHIHIFLSSSAELLAERDLLEIAVARLNEGLPREVPRFKVLRWENHEAQLRPQGMQEHYNELVRDCDVFIFVFHGKVGKYSRQEFEAAWKAMVKTGRPTVYVYHKSTPLDETKLRPRDRQSVENFRKRLDRLQQFAVHYDNLDRLKAHFLDQLTRYLAGRSGEGQPQGQADSRTDHPPAFEMDPPNRKYLLPRIYRLMNEAYDDTALRLLIQLHFRKVDQSLGTQQGRQLVLSQLLDHARRHLQLQRLMEVVAEDRPDLYAYYGPYW